ncbi:hypothetical protein [Paraburkholderia sp. BCC1884]|uniref:hypothetical protein n=1 Tax=Paraburkholderia sp. BCC1884 TaxID=2562668 RepID=UPI001183B377|nr:hypothetical protein [Paraburkholderia sp. BCC1884]
MSSRYEKNGPFDVRSAEFAAFDDDAESLQVLQLASETVLRLAACTHDALARGDEVSANAARVVLAAQLALTTQLIDDLLFDDTAAPTTH